ncbi:MAG: DUF2905 family protein [Minisyncoccia bacterium]|jgi:hypothetical protein
MKIDNLLILTGFLIVLMGVILKLINLEKLPLLPGDILIKKENFVFYFPITTALIISLILTILFTILKK